MPTLRTCVNQTCLAIAQRCRIDIAFTFSSVRLAVQKLEASAKTLLLEWRSLCRYTIPISPADELHSTVNST